MLNMKKGLAIVLAAATVFTFAPVSTLGLTGVVEAQAATATISIPVTAGADATKTTTLTPNTSAVSVDASSEDQTVDITFTGLTASTSQITFTNLGGTAIKYGSTPTTVVANTPVTADAASMTFTVTVTKSTTAADHAITVTADLDGAGSTNAVSAVQTLTVKNTAAAYVNAGKAEFKNVNDNIYMRDVVDTSVDITPSYVVSTSGKSEDGKDLYYQLTATAPSSMTLAQTGYKSEDKSLDINKLQATAKKGSIKLTRLAALSNSTDLYLAAYKLSNDTTDFQLVGYKKVTVVKQNNATYKLKLAKDYYTLSLQTVEKSDDLTNNIKISDIQGTYLDSATVTSFQTKSNWSVSGDNIATAADEDDYKTKKAAGTYGTNTYAVYLTNEGKFIANAAGKTTVTVTASDGSNKIAQTTITLEVLGTSKYDLKATVDGSATAGLVGEDTSNPIVLNTKTLNTYDLSKHMYKNNAAMVLSYESSNAKNTVDENTGVVKATTAVDSFYVTVSGKINGATIAQTKVFFKVNALPFDTLNVTGEDKDSATVLSKLDYESVMNRAHGVPSEAQLAGSQIKYVQIEATGNELKNVTESLNIVSTGGAVVTASLMTQDSNNAFKDVTNSGVITLNTQKASGVAAIKLISAATANNELTESYVFVVVDKKDPDTKEAPSAFKIGTKAGAGYDAKCPSAIKFHDEYKTTAMLVLDQDDDLLATQTLYPDAKNINTNFKYSETDQTVAIATAEGKTEHVLLTYGDGTNTGKKYEIVTITSVPGVKDSVTKIENANTGKVVWTPDMGVAVPEEVIDGNTTFKVTISYPIDKNATTVDITSTNIYNGDPTTSLNQPMLTATKDEKKTDGFTTFYLYPTAQGTQVVSFNPSGRISETDRSIVDNASKQLAVTYRASVKPSKVTGLKVANKKGAKVSVSFDAATNHNMKYWVQKKIGKKVAGKSVASNKATLSVKKGATVKVRVKAYYYDNDGNKHVGAYSSWKTLKTDKK